MVFIWGGREKRGEDRLNKKNYELQGEKINKQPQPFELFRADYRSKILLINSDKKKKEKETASFKVY